MNRFASLAKSTGRLVRDAAMITVLSAASMVGVAIGLAVGAVINGYTSLSSMGAFKTTTSPHETYSQNRDSILEAAKKCFSDSCAETAILIINAPDNPYDQPLRVGTLQDGNAKNDSLYTAEDGLVDAIPGMIHSAVHNIYDQEKAALYEKLWKVPNTAVFAYGTNDPDDSLDIRTIDGLLKIAAESPIPNLRVVVTGHGGEGGINIQNSAIRQEPDTIHIISERNLKFRGLAYLLNKNFGTYQQRTKGKTPAPHKNVDLFLLPCESGRLLDTTHVKKGKSSCVDEMKDLDNFHIYCAAQPFGISNPFNALDGLHEVVDLSLKQGKLLDFDETAFILMNHTNMSHGSFYNPTVYTIQKGKVAFTYSAFDFENEMKDFTQDQKDRLAQTVMEQGGGPESKAMMTRFRSAQNLNGVIKSYDVTKRNFAEMVSPTPLGALAASFIENFGPQPLRRAGHKIERLRRQ